MCQKVDQLFVDDILLRHKFDYLIYMYNMQGFAFVSEKTSSMRIDLVCATRGHGKELMQKCAYFSTIVMGKRVLELDSTVESYGFYRRMGFCSSDHVSLDCLWDTMMTSVHVHGGTPRSPNFKTEKKYGRHHSTKVRKLMHRVPMDDQMSILSDVFGNDVPKMMRELSSRISGYNIQMVQSYPAFLKRMKI